ncbi:phosphate ABC transporter, permease protein PstA [Vibrio sp. UCD-FRSSP16_10]|uniref:phosphate ABC transporter permease PstA n=1 Tax=unclassified Vibrio TaxID=2614977 RepID=UPI000800D8C5|nr:MULTISPECIES: phosphate ABC transporter permease PstA [unclassified Vibrio]OBT06647.1 phosphate ABC transporter, permease protein PstA [Vibrio sp. UCD-FRSSP16_30]OBT12344.1 phosphate ABC transporter, permease protein PstA [Vibrio sp. UCD-FRSSP16_10]
MAVTISILSVLTVLLFIGWKGMAHFWPHTLYEWKNANHQSLIGQVYQREEVPLEQLSTTQRQSIPTQLRQTLSTQTLPELERLVIKIGNRDIFGGGFISEFSHRWGDPIAAADLIVIERKRGGQFFGRVISYESNGKSTAINSSKQLDKLLEQTRADRDRIDFIREHQLDLVAESLVKNDKVLHRLQQDNSQDYKRIDQLSMIKKQLNIRLYRAKKQIEDTQEKIAQRVLVVKDMNNDLHRVSFSTILDAWYPNKMTVLDKVGHWFKQGAHFLIDEPRESNSEGGVFPAIFGTILLVLLMSVAVMPLGVLAGLYLHEYAHNNWLTRLIRITVQNLAGVPSIIYGVFGLGFFVYTLGGSIDELFYSGNLPAPTFGTPGLLWASLTLAMLTLPVVVVTIEDGLSRIPKSVRDGAFALGATKSETIFKVVLPMAMPAVLTALILAVARAAGEVAPLMLVGVVKLAPSLPIDGQFPYIHLERKFMHLGFHIYDAGFQTTNLEGAKSLVYATSMLLVTVIIGLNLIAIRIRNSLRNSYRNLGFDDHVF